jgi:radical SAM superfamily enzyme YgiQ (UPF0313 family)
MIGLPFETEDTIKETILLNRRAKIRHPNISFFIPLYGTRLYTISIENNFFTPGNEVSTEKPSLKLPGISDEKLIYYYKNFHTLITKE